MTDFNVTLHNTYGKDIIQTGFLIVMTLSKSKGMGQGEKMRDDLE